MKKPFLILCLAVAYGACLPHGEVTEIQYNGDYKVNFTDVPFERFHSRHKRNLLSPITAPLDMTLRLCGISEGAISTSVNLVKFIFGALAGQDVCPKTDGLSCFSLIFQAVFNPVKAVETLTCYTFQAIGKQGRALMTKTLDLSIQFFRYVFLPGLHTTLNKLKGTGFLPPQFVAMIEVFNVIYKMLQLIGYVP